jgi:hypothetical protein
VGKNDTFNGKLLNFSGHVDTAVGEKGQDFEHQKKTTQAIK